MQRIAQLLIVVCGFAVQSVCGQDIALRTDEVNPRAFTKAAPSVVKLISDGGENIGTGVILAIHQDDVGFLLTSYSTIAGRDKVAVILKNYPDVLLGHVVEKFLDFDLDLAVVAVKNFPAGQPVISMRELKKTQSGQPATVIFHSENGDWISAPVDIETVDERFVTLSSKTSNLTLPGAPVLNARGEMVALVTHSDSELHDEERTFVQAVAVSSMKPILNQWFAPLKLKEKWHEKNKGLGGWVWAVGGGVLGSTVATVLALTGGSSANGGPQGLPRPPAPPQ